MASVRLENVSKIYNNRVNAINSVSLNIPDKEFVVIVGPSGSGKSTILRMIAGLEEITDGDIFIGEQRVNNVSPRDRDIAMVFQDFALYPHMSVFDNIAFSLKMRKIPRDEIKKRVNEVAGILDIRGLLERKPKQISGGEKQRVALGRAIVRNPKVFLMDEPLSNLDAKLRAQMRIEILRLYRNLNTTVIYVTHDQTEAMTMGTRIIIMKDGLIQQIATPKEIYSNPVNIFVASFIGTPAINLLQGQIQNSGGDYQLRLAEGFLDICTEKGETALNAGYLHKDVTIGVRPEHILISTETSKNGCSLIGEVEIVENMGAEYGISILTSCGNVMVKTNMEKPPEQGDTVNLSVSPERLYLFDTINGNRIS